MTMLPKALLLMAALALAACNNPNRFGAGGAGGAGGAAGGAGGIGTSGLGDPSNPASPAYFNQTVGDRVFFLRRPEHADRHGAPDPDRAGAAG